MKIKFIYLSLLIAINQYANAETITVEKDQVVSNKNIASKDDVQIVYGTSNNSIISNEGTENIMKDGNSNNSTVNKDGNFNSNGGKINNLNVDGGKANILNESEISYSVVSNDGNLNVENSNVNNQTVIDKGFFSATNSNIETMNVSGVDSLVNISDSTLKNVHASEGIFYANKSDIENITIENAKGLQNTRYSDLENSKIKDIKIINSGTEGVAGSGIYMTGSVIEDININSSLVFFRGSQATNINANDNSIIVNLGDEWPSPDAPARVVLSDLNINGGSRLYSNQDVENLYVSDLSSASIFSGKLKDANIDGKLYVSPYSNTNNIKELNGKPTLEGDINISNTGELTMFAGTKGDEANINLQGNMNLFAKDDANNPLNIQQDNEFDLLSLNMINGNVFFGGDEFIALKTNSLSGTGNFYMNTNIAELKGDKIIVNGNATGDFGVMVKDTGKNPVSPDSLNLISYETGDANFKLLNKDETVDLGTYQYNLKQTAEGKWDLISKKNEDGDIISPSTSGILNMANVTPIIDRIQLNTIKNYLDNRSDIDHNIWGNYNFSKDNLDIDSVANLSVKTNGLTIGADKKTEIDETQNLVHGVFVSFQHGNVDFKQGGDGKVKSYSLGAYANWNKNDYFVDGILKVSNFRNDVSPRMNSGDKAYGSYNNYGLSADVKTGFNYNFKNNIISKPYVGLSNLITNDKKYGLSNGMDANVEHAQIYRAEIGLFNELKYENIKPFVKVYTGQEFGTNKNHVYINQNDKFTNNTNGNYYGIETGINGKINTDTDIGLNVSYRNGDDNRSPIAVNLNFAYSF